MAAQRWQRRQEARVKKREAGVERVRGSLVIGGVVRGDSSPGGWKKTSVNVSLARDSCAAGNKDGTARRGGTFSSQIKKSPVEVKEKGTGEGSGLRGIRARIKSSNSPFFAQ